MIKFFTTRRISDTAKNADDISDFLGGPDQAPCQHRHGYVSGETWACSDCGRVFNREEALKLFEETAIYWKPKPITLEEAREKLEAAQGRKPKRADGLMKQALRDQALREEGAQAAIMQLLRTGCVLDYGEPYIPVSAALKLLKGKLTMFEVKCGAV